MSKILVADDFALCREPIAEALRGAGYEVICAADGSEALSAIQEHHPDLVLLDVNMPKLDGLSVLRTIRCNPEFSHTPVIMLTESGERKSVAIAAENKIQGYLLKSKFSLDTLFARVAACLGATETTSAALQPKSSPANLAKSGQRLGTSRIAPTATTEVASSKSRIDEVSQSGNTTPVPSSLSLPTEIRSLEDVQPLINKTDLLRLVVDGLELQPLGPTVQNVIALTTSKECCAEDVAKAATHDQAISIRILKLANSSAYSRGRPVNSVRDAVQRVGLQEVRSLVMTLGVLQQYEVSAGANFDPRLFWEHSIACGLIASAIAKHRQPEKADDGFLWGMVHDVGRLILLHQLPNESSTIGEIAEQLALPLEAVERKALLLDHCEILEKALEHWQFPRAFVAPVVNHHRSRSQLERLGPDHFFSAASVALANRLAHALMLGSSGNEILYPLDDLVAALRIQPSMIAALTTSIPEETRDLKYTMLARANTDNWPDFALGFRAKLGVFRPVCVSAQPEVDAFRIFCERVASPVDDGPPNVGVLYLRDAEELAVLGGKFESEEKARGASSIPLIVICAKGRLDASNPWLKTRLHAIFGTPVRLSVLLSTIRRLTS
ncbi:MAG: HDOD domain-containing protein [Planctomycetota bacterium]